MKQLDEDEWPLYKLMPRQVFTKFVSSVFNTLTELSLRKFFNFILIQRKHYKIFCFTLKHT